MGTPIRPEPQTLSELMGQRQREREQQNPVPDTLRAAADATRDAEPTRAARVLRVQGKTAWPTDFVERNLEVLEVEVDKPEFNAERFWRESPAIAAWMAQDPARVAAAKGRDMERMGRVEGYLKAIGTEYERNNLSVQMRDQTLAMMLGTATPEDEGAVAALHNRQKSLPDVLADRNFFTGIPIANIGQLPITLRMFGAAAKGMAVGAATGAAVGAVRGAVTTGTPQGAGAGALAMGARGAFLGRIPAVMLEGALLEATEAFREYMEMPADRREAGAAMSAAFENNLPEPDIRRIDREVAAAGALVAGVVAGALEALPFEKALRMIPGIRRLGRDGIREMIMAPTTRRLLMRYAGNIVSQMAAEGATETLQSLVQSAGKVLTQRYSEGTLNLLSTDTILREIFSEENVGKALASGRQGMQGGIGFGAVTGGVSTAMDLPAVRRAELNAQRMQAAAEAIHGNDREEAVTLAKDAPEAMREAVASVGSEGVYFDISEFTGYWQEQRTPDGEAANPREVAIALGVSPQEYDAAVESGAPINIPADRLLVDAMGSPVHRQWFADNFRATPNELSKAEAMRQREQASQPLTETVEEVGEMPTREQEAETGLADLRERLTGELRGARVGAEEVTASVATWVEAARTAIARNPDVPVAEVLRRFERVQVVARPVAAFPDGKAVGQFEVTGETMENGAGVQVPVLKTTRTARANAARLESIAAEKGEAKLTDKQREQLQAARQALADAEAVNKTLAPVDFAALRGPVDVQAMTPEQRASVNVESNADVLEQAAFHGTPHTYVGEVRITRASGTVEWYELGGRLPAEVEAELHAGTARATDFPAGRFRLDKIGTGEGAQAYGWGLYFAEAQGVAEGYRRDLSRQDVLTIRGRDGKVLADGNTMTDAELLASGMLEGARPAPSQMTPEVQAAYKRFKDAGATARYEKNRGALYRVDIPDEAVARMLDWDKPLSEQAPEVREAIKSYLQSLPNEVRAMSAITEQTLGAEVYGTIADLAAEMSEDGVADKQQAASLSLLAAGIPGIKYLDAGSRGARPAYRGEPAYLAAAQNMRDNGMDADATLAALQGAYADANVRELTAARDEVFDIQPPQTRNLVVFDDALVTITHRNGEPVTAAERADFLAQEQTLPETLDVDGVARPTRNSEGRPIHPTEEGVRNFWRWATEGGREPLADDTGRPIVVYHGTKDASFDEFNPLAGKFKTANTGAFLTTNPAASDTYAGVGGALYPLYVRTRNNVEMDAQGRGWERLPSTAPVSTPEGVTRISEFADDDTFTTDDLARYARSIGADAVIVANVIDRGPKGVFATPKSIDPSTLVVVFDGADIKSAIGNSGEFGPTANILRQGEAEPRGAFIAPAGRVDGPRLVALFKEKNQTTFLHETAHAFLDIWTDLANDPNASPDFRELVSGVRAELGATEGERLSVAQEEAFAGMFLDYAKSGKAPSVALRQAFASFAAFISKLWSFVKAEIVPANENVRDLLDRLLATDDAIAEARGEFMAPLFPADATINAAFVAARTEAEERTRTEAMRAVIRAEQEWWKRTRSQVEDEARERVNQDRDYIARQILTAGTMPDGTPLDPASPLRTKLNRAEIVGIIGEDATKALPRGKAGAVYNTQGGGLDLSIAAEALGYENGPALIQALQQTVPIDEQVKRVTDATMRERYGDPITEVPEVAVKALRNDNLDRMRQLEMEAILRDHPEAFREAMVRAASRPVNVRELKQWAEEQMADRTLKSIRPAEYLSAERRAGQEAVRAVAKGEWAKAVQAKAKQRAAAALYARAVQVQEELAKFQDLTAKVFGPDERIVKTRNLDIVMAARQFLASVGIGKRQEDTQFYLAQLAEYDPETAKTLEGVVADFSVPPRNDFKSLTYAEFENVRGGVQELWDESKRSETLTVAGRRISKAEAKRDLMGRLVTMEDSAVEGAGRERVTEFRDRANGAVLTAKASLRRVESWVDLMDQGDINGPFRRYIFETLRDRTAEKSEANTKDLLAYDAMLNAIRPTLTRGDIAAPELGPRWVFKGKAHLLGTLLHTGNPSNLAMLLGGRGWSRDGWFRFRDRMVAEGVLTPADFDFVQGVWNLFESRKPEAQKVYRRMFGRYFDEITREGFTIQFPDGMERTYAGGYTPASKDPDASTTAEKRAADAMLEEAYGMRFPTVQKGFTISRVQNFEPLLLSLDIVPKHLDAVNKFIYLAEPVREVGRLLRDPELRAELDRVNPKLVNEMLMPWLQRTSTQVVQTPSGTAAVAKYVDPVAKYLRTTAGASFMFLNVANTLEQATGLSVAAVRVNPKYLSLAQAAVLRSGNTVNEVIEQDNPFMRERMTTQVMEVRRRIDNITTDPNVFQKAQAFAAEHAYVLQAFAQNQIDRTVWYGSYLESLDAGLTVAEARAKANADVRLTQGSFEPVDVARIETGNPWWRLIAMFAGYFNMLANLNATEMQKAVDTMGLKKSMPRLFAVYALGFAVPILTSNLIRKAMMGRAALNDVDGDDEWGYLDDFFGWFFGEQVRAGTAMLPGAGQTINYGVNLFDDKVFNDQLSLSPAVSFVESAGRGVKASYDLITGEPFQRRDIRDMLSLFSLMTRTPAVGFARPLTYLYDVEEGRADPSGPVDFMRGLTSGYAGR